MHYPATRPIPNGPSLPAVPAPVQPFPTRGEEIAAIVPAGCRCAFNNGNGEHCRRAFGGGNEELGTVLLSSVNRHKTQGT